MDVSNDMLQAAIKKAVEAGLLPRHASKDDARINLDLMRAILQAAIDAAPREHERCVPVAAEGVLRLSEVSAFRRRFANRN